MNVNIYMGRFGRDPELSYSQAGKPVCSFSIAVDHPFGKKDNEPAWIRCVAFGKTAEAIAKYFSKGDQISIEGGVAANNWTDKNGNKRNDLQTIVKRFYFSGTTSNSERNQSHGTVNSRSEGSGGKTNPQEGKQQNDDLPF
jgi:single-strand DNA-binding protein